MIRLSFSLGGPPTLSLCLSIFLGLVIMPSASNEEGFLEHVQLIPLLAAAFVLLPTVWSSCHWRPKSVTIAGSVFFSILIAGVGREVSFGRVYGLEPEFVKLIKLSMAICVASIITISTVNFFRQKKNFVKLANTVQKERFILTVMSITFFAIAEILFERKLFSISHNQLLEESLEIASYVSMLLLAIRIRMK